MIQNVIPHTPIHQDGTSQQDRVLPAIDPAYVPVEGRSVEALIQEAQRLAQELLFFDEQNRADTNWESFLIEDPAAYQKMSDAEKKEHRSVWAHQLATYIDDPKSFEQQPDIQHKLARPHVALWLTFLKLLHQVKEQLNGLTKKHLDFYFQERLGAMPQQPVPDVVNVLVTLVEDMGQLEIKKGTVLLAGQDAQGNKLQYETTRDTVISVATLEQVKTVFTEKQMLSIAEAHQWYADDDDHGFTRIMEMALGAPNPGDPLPPLPNGMDNLQAVYDRVKKQDTGAIDYVTRQLFLSLEDFNFILETYQQDLTNEVAGVVWQQVYALLDEAFKNKTRQQRQDTLQKIHEDKGFDALLQHVYGSPVPGEDLPLYKGQPAIVADIRADLQGEDVSLQRQAVTYVQDELRLTVSEFFELLALYENTQATQAEWEAMYRILELAERKVRGVVFTSPVEEKRSDVLAEPDARAATFTLSGNADESARFKTLGGGTTMQPANLGFAIASPTLRLEEGTRTITAWMAFDPDTTDRDALTDLFHNTPPFNLHLSSNTQWFQPAASTMVFGDHIIGLPQGTYEGELDAAAQKMVISDGPALVTADVNSYLVDTDGQIFRIISVEAVDTALVQRVGQTVSPHQMQKYLPQDIYLNALQVVITLQENELPVLPIAQEASADFMYSAHPVLVFSLHHTLQGQGDEQTYVSAYRQLMGIALERVYLRVSVAGMRSLVLQNDRSTLDPKKPFELFGYEPQTGNSFYLTHPELAMKPVDVLRLTAQWMKAPEDFKTHYKNYWRIDANQPDLPEEDYRIQGNDTFKGLVTLYDHRSEFSLGAVTLFPEGGEMQVADIPQKIYDTAPTYQYQYREDGALPAEVLDAERYFRIELAPVDFQHDVHQGLFTKQVQSDNPAIKTLHINPPYTPKVKSLRVGYTAHTEMVVGTVAHREDGLYHLHPFGFSILDDQATPSLLPAYEDEGTLYLGIDQLAPPQSLSLLFQMAEGSADPDVEKPVVHWSYLQHNVWIPMPATAIVSDTTNGLMNTGIIHLEIPAAATRQDTLMPGGLHWLKASVAQNTRGLSDTIAIATQAISATFCSEVVAPSHFVNLLAPGSITETEVPNPAIDELTQPYTSSKGKPAEEDAAFYQRISERLRHKDRAVTMWDYERIVLEQFPEVYKVKCLPGTIEGAAQPGQVSLIVIPDVVGKLPFNPFEPKVPSDTLAQIYQYLEDRTPAYADITVNNPTYLQVKTRCVVKFKTGYNEGFYKAQLIEELKRFLAPWAYGQDSNITIGGTIYASVLINFIAERPYIEYVANMKLFQSEDGINFTDVRTLNNGKNMVVASRPDMILVSAQSHEIDVVDENGYHEDDYEGINYMQIELDFEVSDDLQS